MKLFLDTTYFLALLNLHNSLTPPDFLNSLRVNDKFEELYYSSITIFELQALGAKRIIKQKITKSDVIKGIQSLLLSPNLIQVSTQSSLITDMALELRGLHQDFIDCLILSSAALSSDILISEDAKINKLSNEPIFLRILSGFSKTKFKVMTSNQISSMF